ncbi:MAG: phospholipid scramblase 1 [Phylliscum demangeonii]|nr:MAG: phospholipid scramblase 1 [Phylliscum demangeonii]
MDKVLLFLAFVDLIFFGTGGLLVGLAFKAKNDMARGATVDNVAADLLLMHTPLNAAIANAGLIFAAFLVSVPALGMQRNRGWLKVYGGLVLLSAIFTLVLGLLIWFSTLKTRSMLQVLWTQQDSRTQSLLQQRFNCCGYLDAATPAFQPDRTCSNALMAAQKAGCVGAFSDFANSFLDIVFTAIFGLVALDTIVLLAVAVLLRDRLERARFYFSDLKHGIGTI